MSPGGEIPDFDITWEVENVPKVTLLGAGSAVFSRQLIMDVLLIPGLDMGSFALVDIDPERLELAHQLAEKVIALTGKNWTVRASTDRCKVMGDSDYLINFIEVNGLQTVRFDHEIPMKYGIKQCIGDTIGPGGVFKALRTGPEWLEILRDAEALCPDVLVLNYTNPMSILTLAALWATDLRVVGLCHSVQGTSERLASYAEVPYEEMHWRCAGINHMGWFTELSHDGRDLYPLLKERAREAVLRSCNNLATLSPNPAVTFPSMYPTFASGTTSSKNTSALVSWAKLAFT
jgi:alpha-galactosidase